MKFNKFTLEHFSFVLVFLLTLGYRFYGIRHPLLGDGEASLALQAFAISTGNGLVVGSQVLYLQLTGILFFLFGSSEFWSRFVPALSGSLLVLAPLLFKPLISSKAGRAAPLLLSLLLAVEPGLTAASRNADSRIITITTFIFTLGFYFRGQTALTGIFAGLALLSGPFLWPGLIGFAAARLWNGSSLADAWGGNETHPPEISPSRPGVKSLAAWSAGTLIFIGSLFFIVPSGLSGAASSLLDYVSGWQQVSKVSPQMMGITLAAYQPLGLLLTLSVLVWNWRRKDNLDAFLWKWWVAALLLALANPGMTTMDITWSMLPLCAMTARQLTRMVHLDSQEKWSLVGQTAITTLLLLFAIYSLVGITNPSLPNQPTDPALRFAIFGGSVILLGLITLLVAWGWSLSVAWSGFTWGVCLILAAYVLAGSWNAAGLGRNPHNSLWRSEPQPLEGQLLAQTVADYSRWRYGRPDVMEVTIQDIGSPALRWLLRSQRLLNQVASVSPSSQPPLIITREQKQLNLPASYSGQDFIWEYQPAWDLIAPLEWLRWIHFKEAPANVQTVVLWVRSDLFPNSVKSIGAPVE